MANPLLNADGLPPGYNFRPDWEVTPRQVKAMLDRREDFVLLDCRTTGEYQVAKIEPNRLVPLQEVASRINELEDSRDKKIVVYCHRGVRSLRFAEFLRQQGFKDVKSMAGGIDVWSLDVDASVKRY